MKYCNSNDLYSNSKPKIISYSKAIICTQVAELKAHMPMEMLRMLKRTFKDALGMNSNYITLFNNKMLPWFYL